LVFICKGFGVLQPVLCLAGVLFCCFALFCLVKKNKKKKTTFADNLLTLMSSKMSMSFFLRKEIKVFDEIFQDFSPYNGLQWTPTVSRSK